MTFGCLESVDFVSFASTKGSLSILSAREILCIRAQIIGGLPCRDLCIHLFAQHKRLTTNVTNKGCVGTSHRVDFAKVELVVSLFFLSISLARIKRVSLLCSLSLCPVAVFIYNLAERGTHSVCLRSARGEEQVRLNTRS